ncbi:unnamed protein product [Linum trigynum]|uniref:Uncharacterized protein n=1 Tax=Linum trigynum TaxID=586398 RepID=A0AAV2D709_9ROSI
MTEASTQKEEEHGWDAAVLFSIKFDGASLYQMNIDKDDGQLADTGAHLNERWTYGMGFALVKQKLYAFGRIPGLDSLDFFTCDLECKAKPNEFKKAGKLLAPKTAPIVIPFKNKEIIIISTGVRQPEGYVDRPKLPYCEILHLPDGGAYRLEGIRTPWDDTYGTCFGFSPISSGHVVLGNEVYVHMMAGPWGFKSRLYVLNMITRKWSICRDPNGYCYTSDRNVAVAPLPRALNPIYGYWYSFNHIVNDVLFSVVVDPQFEDPNKKAKKIFIGAISLKDLAGLNHPGNMAQRPASLHEFVPSLEKLEHLLTTNYSGYEGGKGWVMALDPHDDKLFALFLCFQDDVEFKDHILACKFELFEKPKDAAAAASNRESSSRGYDCNILCHSLYKHCFPHNMQPLYTFTAADYYQLLL